jgi:hypothetical protein
MKLLILTTDDWPVRDPDSFRTIFFNHKNIHWAFRIAVTKAYYSNISWAPLLVVTTTELYYALRCIPARKIYALPVIQSVACIPGNFSSEAC